MHTFPVDPKAKYSIFGSVLPFLGWRTLPIQTPRGTITREFFMLEWFGLGFGYMLKKKKAHGKPG